MNSISDFLERLYNSFVVRDILGFTVPGSIFLLSSFGLLERQIPEVFREHPSLSSLASLDGILTKSITVWQILVFIAVSFVAGWTIQALHYGLVDWVFQLLRFRDRLSVLWPLFGVLHYARSISGSEESRPPVRSLITMGAVAPDRATATSRSGTEQQRSSLPDRYFERISALMLMSANLSMAAIPLLVLLAIEFKLPWWLSLIGAIAIVTLYLEHWRLFHARNLRHNVLANLESSEHANPN